MFFRRRKKSHSVVEEIELLKRIEVNLSELINEVDDTSRKERLQVALTKIQGRAAYNTYESKIKLENLIEETDELERNIRFMISDVEKRKEIDRYVTAVQKLDSPFKRPVSHPLIKSLKGFDDIVLRLNENIFENRITVRESSLIMEEMLRKISEEPDDYIAQEYAIKLQEAEDSQKSSSVNIRKYSNVLSYIYRTKRLLKNLIDDAKIRGTKVAYKEISRYIDCEYVSNNIFNPSVLKTYFDTLADMMKKAFKGTEITIEITEPYSNFVDGVIANDKSFKKLNEARAQIRIKEELKDMVVEPKAEGSGESKAEGSAQKKPATNKKED